MDPQENQAVPQTDEVQTPVSDSPTEKEETPVETEVTQEVAPQETAEAPTDYQEPELPEGSEQGRAFAKFRHENKQLKEELEELKKGLSERKTRQSSFDQLKKPQTSDIDQTVEYKLDEIRAREKYPQLDPSSEKFDSKFEKEVAANYFFSLYNGEPARITEIARELTERRGVPAKDLKKVEADVTERVKAGITQKEQASLTASSRSQPGFSSAQEHQSLVERSRTGDNEAIAERLKRVR